MWCIDTIHQAAPGTSISTPFFGYEVGNEEHRVWVLRAIAGDDLTYEEAREHRRHSYAIGQIDAVAACPYIAAPIDLVDGWDVFTIAEIADGVLDKELRRVGGLPPPEVDALAHALKGALDVLHGLDFVHGDMREANVLRFDGQWKLGDLGGVAKRGELIEVIQREPEYRRPGAAIGEPADPANDLYALDVVLEHARNGMPLAGGG